MLNPLFWKQFAHFHKYREEMYSTLSLINEPQICNCSLSAIQPMFYHNLGWDILK